MRGHPLAPECFRSRRSVATGQQDRPSARHSSQQCLELGFFFFHFFRWWSVAGMSGCILSSSLGLGIIRFRTRLRASSTYTGRAEKEARTIARGLPGPRFHLGPVPAGGWAHAPRPTSARGLSGSDGRLARRPKHRTALPLLDTDTRSHGCCFN